MKSTFVKTASLDYILKYYLLDTDCRFSQVSTNSAGIILKIIRSIAIVKKDTVNISSGDNSLEAFLRYYAKQEISQEMFEFISNSNFRIILKPIGFLSDL